MTTAIRDDGRSQRVLSKAIGNGEQYITQLLQGKQPTVPNFIALCEALGVCPSYIINGNAVPPEMDELAEIFSILNTDNRAILLRVAKGFAHNQTKST
ncbi:protein containing helix-turn-helix type 3 domain [Pseudovibrio sp. FO-BEG1]|nr:protein containing helix-turn-helix type 3 domain [Pseudovibrio sp. FO-BEG1]